MLKRKEEETDEKTDSIPPIPLTLIQLYPISILKDVHKFGVQGDKNILNANNTLHSAEGCQKLVKKVGLPTLTKDEGPIHGTSLDLFGDGYPGLM